MMGVAMFFAGFVFMLGLLMAGSGCADLVVGRDAGWRAAMVVGLQTAFHSFFLGCGWRGGVNRSDG